MKREGLLRYGKMKGDGSTKAVCVAPDTGLRFVRRVESSSDSDSSVEIDARETCRSKDVLRVEIEVKSPRTWLEDVTEKWNEYAKAGLPNLCGCAPEKGGNLSKKMRSRGFTRTVFWAGRGQDGRQ